MSKIFIFIGHCCDEEYPVILEHLKIISAGCVGGSFYTDAKKEDL